MELTVHTGFPSRPCPPPGSGGGCFIGEWRCLCRVPRGYGLFSALLPHSAWRFLHCLAGDGCVFHTLAVVTLTSLALDPFWTPWLCGNVGFLTSGPGFLVNGPLPLHSGQWFGPEHHSALPFSSGSLWWRLWGL